MANKLRALTQDYIRKCDEVIKANDRDWALKLQESLTATFEGYIKGFDNNLDYTMPNLGGYGNYHDADYVNNIVKLKCKLVSFLATDCMITTNIPKDDKNGINITNTSNAINQNTSNINNSVNINIDALVEESKKEIEDNEYLTEEEKNEVLEKIKEIEQISKLEESKNKKWLKLRPTMEWIGTKGVAVATAVLELITAIIKM